MKVWEMYCDPETGESSRREVERAGVITPEAAAANDVAQAQAAATDRAAWATIRDEIDLLAVDPPRTLSNAQRDRAIATLARAIKRMAKRMHTEFQ